MNIHALRTVYYVYIYIYTRLVCSHYYHMHLFTGLTWIDSIFTCIHEGNFRIFPLLRGLTCECKNSFRTRASSKFRTHRINKTCVKHRIFLGKPVLSPGWKKYFSCLVVTTFIYHFVPLAISQSSQRTSVVCFWGFRKMQFCQVR